jgi:hypothetical protein
MARMLRTSERTTFTSCRQKWWWLYEERLRPKIAAPALRFGTLVHMALAERYPPGVKRGPHPSGTFRRLYDEELVNAYAFGFRDEDGKWNDAASLGEAMLNAFVDEYGKDSDWRVIASEQTFRVRLQKGLIYVGTFDGVWKNRSNKKIWLKEWKTAAQFWTTHLALDEQAGSYWAYAPPWLRGQGILTPDDDLAGILYTFLRKAMPDTRPKNDFGQSLNKNGTISKRQPNPLFERVPVFRDKYDRMMIRGRSIAQHEEMEKIRYGSGGMSLYKSPSRFNCSGCPFIDPCELHETGADYRPLFRSHYERYDPYTDHEIYEEGKRG